MTLTRLPRSTIQFTFVYNTYMLPVTVSDLDHLYFGQQNSPVGFPQAPPPALGSGFLLAGSTRVLAEPVGQLGRPK